jgi:hypothetical protein
MTTFPNSPRLHKGALIGIDIFNPLANVIVFQYNPETMTRTLDPRTTGGADGGDKSEALRLSGPPKETITLSVEFDAVDQLGQPSSLAEVSGVYPALSALEMLLYPKSALVITNTVRALLGKTEIISPITPLTFLVWGRLRVLPVRLTSLSITEQAYDALLNPIQAKVDLSLYVLSYADLKLSNPGYSLFLAHQIAKETLATINTLSVARNFDFKLS